MSAAFTMITGSSTSSKTLNKGFQYDPELFMATMWQPCSFSHVVISRKSFVNVSNDGFLTVSPFLDIQLSFAYMVVWIYSEVPKNIT